jgi:hypothetical protein
MRKRFQTDPLPDLYTDYNDARRFVTEQIAGLIAASEPHITDHSDRHLADVMGRALQLIGTETAYFTPYELYLLAVSIIFHDVGNLHGRKDHQDKVARIYDSARRKEPRFATERNVLLAITGAHTGCTKEGGSDTLNAVGRLNFLANPVRAQELAAILRFADELSEGPHRTSAYHLNHGMYKPESRIFHKYAAASDYVVDPALGRIAITYSFDLERGAAGIEAGNGISLRDLLGFCYARAVKLDQERKYCKHYCRLLTGIQETGISLHFFFAGQKLDLDVPPIVLSDLVVPGESAKRIEDCDSRYDIQKLVTALSTMCEETDASLQ